MSAATSPGWVAFGLIAGVPSAGLWMLYVVLFAPYLLPQLAGVPWLVLLVLLLGELVPLVVGTTLLVSERARRSGHGVLTGFGAGLLAGFTLVCLLLSLPVLIGSFDVGPVSFG
jgi:hypothetical protein